VRVGATGRPKPDVQQEQQGKCLRVIARMDVPPSSFDYDRRFLIRRAAVDNAWHTRSAYSHRALAPRAQLSSPSRSALGSVSDLHCIGTHGCPSVEV
jgi:hypothetical protein